MDWVEGRVTKVVDGDTFDMRVEWVGKANKETYSNNETIRIAGIDAPERGTIAGTMATQGLRAAIEGQYVHCDVQARDAYGRLVCSYRVAVPR